MGKKTNFPIKILVLFLTFIGILTVSTTVHELKHYYDLKDITEIKEVCLLNLPLEINLESSVGYVEYIKNQDTEGIRFELKAWALELFFIVILSYIVLHYFFIQNYESSLKKRGTNK